MTEDKTALPLFDWSDLEVISLGSRADRLRQCASARSLQLLDMLMVNEPKHKQLELELDDGTVSFVPKPNQRFLSYRMTEFLLSRSSPKVMRYCFRLEHQNVVFLGDLVALRDYEVERIVGCGEPIRWMDAALKSIGLSFGLKVAGWRRPIDGFTHRHLGPGLGRPGLNLVR